MYVRAQNSELAPEVDIYAQPSPSSSSAVISRATSFLDELPVSPPVSWPPKCRLGTNVRDLRSDQQARSHSMQAWIPCPQPWRRPLRLSQRPQWYRLGCWLNHRGLQHGSGQGIQLAQSQRCPGCLLSRVANKKLACTGTHCPFLQMPVLTWLAATAGLWCAQTHRADQQFAVCGHTSGRHCSTHFTRGTCSAEQRDIQCDGEDGFWQPTLERLPAAARH